MKPKNIFALRGPANVGKSATLRSFFGKLRAAYPTAGIEWINPLGSDEADFTVIIDIGGVRIGIESEGDPNGRLVTRDIGYAILQVDNHATVEGVVFAHDGDAVVLGWHALNGLRLRVDPRRRKLVDAGPPVAASGAIHNTGGRSNPVRGDLFIERSHPTPLLFFSGAARGKDIGRGARHRSKQRGVLARCAAPLKNKRIGVRFGRSINRPPLAGLGSPAPAAAKELYGHE
jgi:hypothetical protein